ncbi:hypothetical protein [Geminicoccus flavidas]|uniref:hypothetical protein n=1 Tax=Geminicoccus flavidas TaxID=2506407 RepID=UPI00135C6E2E|nr:hypothetical protein [Geminicoccus flavidas]
MLVLSVVLAGTAAPPDPGAPAAPEDQEARPQDQDGQESYWTEERMREAVPFPMPKVDEEEGKQQAPLPSDPGEPSSHSPASPPQRP